MPTTASSYLPASWRTAFGSFGAAVVLGCLSPVAGADCGQGEETERERAERLGMFDVTLAARGSAGCGREELSKLRMSLGGGTARAQYRWTRAPNGRNERHGVTFTPVDRGRLRFRAHAERDIDLDTGASGTRVRLENGLRVGGIRSTAKLVRETASERRMTGLDVNARTVLFGERLSAEVQHGEWRTRDASSGAGSRRRSALALEYARGAASIKTRYARKADTSYGLGHVYAAGAAVSREGPGTRRDLAAFTAEITKRENGRAVQSLGVSAIRKDRSRSRTLKLDFSQSAGGLRQTSLRLSRSGRRAMTLEGGVAVKTGCVSTDAALTLAAKYRF